MTSMFRNTASALLLTLACASTAQAFPPCPVDEAGIVPLDSPNPPDNGVLPWKVATVTSVGTLASETFIADCKRIAHAPRAGECKVDVFHLDELPSSSSSGAIAGTPQYSDINRIGVVGLPDIRTAGVALHRPVYALTMGINTTPLANAGDWIDIAQLQMDTDIGADVAQRAIYRLRKITRVAGTADIELILLLPGTKQTVVVARAPLNAKYNSASISLRWSPLVAPADTMISTDTIVDDSVAGASDYSANTSLSLYVDDNKIYGAMLKQQAPSIASIGVLDYNLPQGLLFATNPPDDPGLVPITPTPVWTDSLSSGVATDSADPLDNTQAVDLPGALLIYYYTQFSVVSN